MCKQTESISFEITPVNFMKIGFFVGAGFFAAVYGCVVIIGWINRFAGWIGGLT